MNHSKFTVLILFFLVYSCSTKPSKKQSEFAGNSFKMCIGEKPASMIPRNVTDVHTAIIMNQVMEGLVGINPSDMKIIPLIASSWKISPDQLTYEFTIRDDVYFHECDILNSKSKRKLSLDDIVYTFEKIAEKDKNGNPTSAYSSFFKGSINGIDNYHDGVTKTITGISIEKNNVIKIKLTQIDSDFLYKLANVNASIVSKKMSENEHSFMIGTGPFIYKGFDNEGKNQITLSKNQEYYLNDKDGNALPYLDNIFITVENKKLDELTKFENGEIDFIGTLPTSKISAMLEGRMKDFNGVPPLFILRNNPLLATNFYFFNMYDKRFADVKVRQAFNYAINRSKITQKVLKGQAYEDGVYGIVPPISSIFRAYDYKGVKDVSYDFNPEKAKKLLSEAGYPNGQNFGTVTLRLNLGDVHSAVAEEFADQIKSVLGINVNIDASSFEQKTSDANYLKGDLFRITWFADYLSPESFFMNFYGKIVPKSLDEPSFVNQSRYQNDKFDALVDKAKTETKLSERLKIFAEAEIELMKNPPIIPLWYNGDIQILYSKVRNFHENPLNYFNLREVYIKEWSKSEYENRIK
jgi:oligopeptide transport system substrate-binding protein